MANFIIGSGYLLDFSDLATSGPKLSAPFVKTPTRFEIDEGGGIREVFVGTGFTYAANGYPSGGLVTELTVYDGSDIVARYTELSASAATLSGFFATGNYLGIQAYLFSGDDVIVGGDDEDVLHGFTGTDILTGGDGDDVIYGDEGNDLIDGGSGRDAAVYSKAMSNYGITRVKGDLWTIYDKTGPEGSDILTYIETLKFADKSITLFYIDRTTETATTNILRSATAYTEISVFVANNVMTKAQAVTDLVKLADATTSVATLSYQFFTGKIPSLGGIDYLVSATGPNANNLNSAYYQSFNLENRYINFAVNLGKVGEGNAKFTAEYGALSLFDATKKAYATIFGGTPTDAKVHALIDTRVDYFASYGGDGAGGIGTKAAMVGWLLAEAAKADVGMYSKANDAFLTDLADGATFAVDLIGVYGKAAYAYYG
ncbi:hypothetical protein [Caulobacter sp.]|uniref:hypothetical protein n=1 Tax=Caulobacter sp. TaxID=78 RepID=UPI001B243844|nr:hypothetical protein [Caulobacter sp.]MBO9545275.1 hypothetical protein [Caulobacter sp.]